MWIEVHQSLPTHAKTLEAAALLDVAEAQVVGHVVCLWLWALDNSKDGQLRVDQPRVLAKAALWPGDPGRFLDALVASGFVDENGAIHDWDDYTGRLMERRERVAELTRARVAAYRSRQQTPTIEGSNATGNAGRNARRNVPVTASNAPTGPNLTGPTGGTRARGGSGAPDADAPDAFPRASSDDDTERTRQASWQTHLLAAFDALDLPAPQLDGAEGRAARRLVTQHGAGDVAACWAAIANGRYGDEFDQRHLSFTHLAGKNRLANFLAERNGQYRPHAPPRMHALPPDVQPQSQQRQPLPPDLPDVGELKPVSAADFAKFAREARRRQTTAPTPPEPPA